MSYLVLARKYRPRNFAEMVGQDHVVQALRNALTTQRLHHAYLFTGTRGVGKTTVSRILAKSLNCQGLDGQGGITATPCGVCQACSDIDAGRSVDYTELDAASNRGIEDVQSLLEQAAYKPVQGRFKVFMIDEVHMLSGPAFNSMLKTLEEPPEYMKFVLATTDPQKVPVTVLSRCLQFNLRPMAPETIREHLRQVLALEAVAFDAQALRLLARAARGSMRDALSLTDQAIAFGAGALTEATVRTMLGSVDRSYVLRLLEALARGDGRTVVETVESLRLNGLSAASTLEEMATLLQRMAVLQTIGSAVADSADDCDTEAEDTARLAALLPSDETQLLYSICLHGRGDLGLAPDEYAALTMVLLRLLAFKPAVRTQVPVAAVAPVGGAPLVEKKTLNNAPGATTHAPSRSAAPAFGSSVAAPAASERAVAPWEDLPEPLESPAVSSPSASVAPSHANAPPAVIAPVIGVAVASLAAGRDMEGATGPLPPGLMLPVRTPQLRDDATALDEVGAGDAGRLGLAPRATPVDHRVVGIPVRQLPESQADASAAAQVTPVFIPSEDGDFWYATVGALVDAQAIGAMVRELALQSQLVARDEGQWLLRVERESLNQSGSRDRLAQALKDAGFAVALTVEVGRVTDSPARRSASASNERQSAAEQLIYSTPLVQHLMRDFGARVVPGSIRPL